MKVACIGNMNNMMFSLCRYLRDKNIDAYLFVSKDELKTLPHFLPHNDTFSNSFQEYTYNIDWGGGIKQFKNIDIRTIRQDLKGFNFIIVCGTSLAYLYKAGIQADIYFPHGSDIARFPFYGDKMSFLQKFFLSKGSYSFFKSQKLGIQKNTKIINTEASTNYWRNKINQLEVDKKVRYFGCPMVYHKEYTEENILKNAKKIKKFNFYKSIRKNNDLVIVSQATQTWYKEVDATGRRSKGNNQLIIGFYDFLQSKPLKIDAKLILFEYGKDVQHSKNLINELGIPENVIWHPKCSRKEILSLLYFADFACGEFSPGCIGGNTTWEALVSKKCLLHYLNTEETKFYGFIDTPYPFVNVKESDQIAQIFLDYLKNPEKYKTIGKKGFDWYIKYFVEKSTNEWIRLITNKKHLT